VACPDLDIDGVSRVLICVCDPEIAYLLHHHLVGIWDGDVSARQDHVGAYVEGVWRRRA
jgi:hypothetical protein